MKTKLLLCFSFIYFFSFSQVVQLQTFATGFTNPVEMTHPANDSRFFVVQQEGLIKILNSNGTTTATPFINLSSIISTGGERGLLGLAFHPDYATNGFFYVNYTNIAGNTVIAKYSVSTNPDVAQTTGTILLTITQPYANHNGGNLKFGPDGYLYIGMGDGGSGGDPGNRAQNINENLGKILRIDVNSGTPYGIPPTNPFVGIAGNDEIWAIGVRNPWKFSFNRLNGDLWIADVGQNSIEEIDKVVSPLPAGLNFGWRCYEGNAAYNTATCAPAGTMVMPFAQYSHSTGGCSITGGYFYTGTQYPNFQNKYFFADYCLNRIGYVDPTGTITYSQTFTGDNYFTTFGEDINGELYVTGQANGTIYKITDSSLSNSNFNNTIFSIYPNPAKREFFIKYSSDKIPNKITIYDVSGKLVYIQIIDNPNMSISTATLALGTYIASIEDNLGNSFKTKLLVE